MKLGCVKNNKEQAEVSIVITDTINHTASWLGHLSDVDNQRCGDGY